MRLGSVRRACGGVFSRRSYCITRKRFSSETTSILASESTATAAKLGFGSLIARIGGRSMTTDFLSAWPCTRIPHASQAMTTKRKVFIEYLLEQRNTRGHRPRLQFHFPLL